MTHSHELALLYRRAHDVMRNHDGLQPHEAFGELLKYLFFRQSVEHNGNGKGSGRKAPKPNRPGDWSATEIRQRFDAFVARSENSGAAHWKEHSFNLTDAALLAVNRLFADVEFYRVAFDIRSAALREFLSPEVRRGLGIYLTPDAVVSMTVRVIQPAPDGITYDPACGSGTFLVESLRYWIDERFGAPFNIIGSEKSQRMLQVAELNLAHQADTVFHGFIHDALARVESLSDSRIKAGAVDAILTNPPFGVSIDSSQIADGYFETASAGNTANARIPSEILFLEQALRLLRPGGKLGIVLPRSVITNARLRGARQVLGTKGYIFAAALLPPETFAATGTQTSTCVLFVQKYAEGESAHTPVRIAFANVNNVGHDSTGRPRTDSELPELATNILRAITEGQESPLVRLLPEMPKEVTFDRLLDVAIGSSGAPGRRLSEVVLTMSTGRTPPRLAYTEMGVFTVKVGNLTGHGIGWQARDRNFVPESYLDRRGFKDLLLAPGDIVLTSSAHTPKYIAKKVDIIEEIPDEVGGRAVFVGEVLRIRVNPSLVDPYRLLAFLRKDTTVERIQSMVRGQTAHLMPIDLGELQIPDVVFEPSDILDSLCDLLRREAALAAELDQVQRNEAALLSAVFGS